MSFTKETSEQAHSCSQRGCWVPWSSSGASSGKAGCSRLTAQVAGRSGEPKPWVPGAERVEAGSRYWAVGAVGHGGCLRRWLSTEA